MSSTIRAIGIAWYRREDYPRILQIMEDAHLLPRTFEKWLYAAEKGREKLLRSGALVVKAEIEPDAFVACCQSSGHKVDAQGRMAFSNLVAYEYAMKGK
jgi:hypothetical protein